MRRVSLPIMRWHWSRWFLTRRSHWLNSLVFVYFLPPHTQYAIWRSLGTQNLLNDWIKGERKASSEGAYLKPVLLHICGFYPLQVVSFIFAFFISSLFLTQFSYRESRTWFSYRESRTLSLMMCFLIWFLSFILF